MGCMLPPGSPVPFPRAQAEPHAELGLGLMGHSQEPGLCGKAIWPLPARAACAPLCPEDSRGPEQGRSPTDLTEDRDWA